jgi:hypothetical protein
MDPHSFRINVVLPYLAFNHFYDKGKIYIGQRNLLDVENALHSANNI